MGACETLHGIAENAAGLKDSKLVCHLETDKCGYMRAISPVYQRRGPQIS